MFKLTGDRFLKPEVISEPDIKTIRRTNQDEFLIFASDGLWDVLSNEMACNVVRQSLDEADPADPVGLIASTSSPTTAGVGTSEASNTLPEEQQQHEQTQEGEEQMEPRCRMASAILARLALGRGSGDNISVIVIDLRRA